MYYIVHITIGRTKTSITITTTLHAKGRVGHGAFTHTSPHSDTTPQ